MPNRAEVLKEKYQNSIGLPFSEVLSEAEIQAVLDTQGVTYRQVLYTPMVVLWSWLSQVLDADGSLSHAVKRVTTWMRVAGLSVPSANTGAYSKARKRLPEAIFPPLLKRVATALQGQVSSTQRWCGRVVKAFDATTVLMSDTAANQQKYPQHSNQKSGCGFPILKLQVWFCVTTGAVLEVAMAPLSGERMALSPPTLSDVVPRRCGGGRFGLRHLCRFGWGHRDGSRCRLSQASSTPL